MKATTGRIVHIKSDSAEPRPAMVVRANDDETIDVQIFPSNGEGRPDLVHLQFRSSVPHENAADESELCWYWPPRGS